MLTAEQVDQLDALAAGSTLLSRLFLDEPDEPLLGRLAEPATMESWPLARAENAHARALITQAAAGDPEAIKSEFQRLFIGPAPRPAPPYESVYRGTERLLFGEHTAQVRQAYTDAGFVAPRVGAEPDDHIGLELDFVARMAAQAVTAADSDNHAAASEAAAVVDRFLSTHLLQWAPQWAEQFTHDAEHDFYVGAGLLAADLLVQAIPMTTAGPRSEDGGPVES